MQLGPQAAENHQLRSNIAPPELRAGRCAVPEPVLWGLQRCRCCCRHACCRDPKWIQKNVVPAKDYMQNGFNSSALGSEVCTCSAPRAAYNAHHFRCPLPAELLQPSPSYPACLSALCPAAARAVQITRDGKGRVDVFLTTPGKAHPSPVYPTAGTHLIPLKKVRSGPPAQPSCMGPPDRLHHKFKKRTNQPLWPILGPCTRENGLPDARTRAHTHARAHAHKQHACAHTQKSMCMACCCSLQGEIVEVVLQNLNANANNGDYRGEAGINRTAQEQHPFHLHGHHFWVCAGPSIPALA